MRYISLDGWFVVTTQNEEERKALDGSLRHYRENVSPQPPLNVDPIVRPQPAPIIELHPDPELPPPPPPPPPPPSDVEDPPPPPPPVIGDPAPPTPPTPPPSAGFIFLHSFETSVTEGGAYALQAASSSRGTLTNFGRHGSRAVQLRTLNGDAGVAGSGGGRRCDLGLSIERTGNVVEGTEQWWAHSVFLPDGFLLPTHYSWDNTLLDFHHTGSFGVAPFHLNVNTRNGSPPCFLINAWGGAIGQNREDIKLFGGARVKQNVWYDFVHHIKWSSSNSIGFAKTWAREYTDPVYTLQHHRRLATLFAGMGVYLKLANYHNKNEASNDVIHDRIVLGRDASVALAPLVG